MTTVPPGEPDPGAGVGRLLGRGVRPSPGVPRGAIGEPCPYVGSSARPGSTAKVHLVSALGPAHAGAIDREDWQMTYVLIAIVALYYVLTGSVARAALSLAASQRK